MYFTLRRYALLALSFAGSATLLFSCAKSSSSVQYDYETLMTERSENRTIVMTENGKRSYSFTAPIIEGYSLAKNPYQEFRDGIKMVTYTSDSLSLQDAQITANYAIYYDKQKLWEATLSSPDLRRFTPSSYSGMLAPRRYTLTSTLRFCNPMAGTLALASRPMRI